MNVENCFTTGSSIVASSSTNGTGNQLSALSRPLNSDHDRVAAEKLQIKEAATNGFGHHAHEVNGARQQTNNLKTKLNDDSPYLGN